jgi:hypothetical protein
MSIRTRLARLEKQAGVADARCPHGWGRDELVHVFGRSVDASDYPDGELPEQDIPDDQLPPDARPCPACGWEPEVRLIYEVVVRTPEEVAVLGEQERDGA